jgi:hypothetical protein
MTLARADCVKHERTHAAEEIVDPGPSPQLKSEHVREVIGIGRLEFQSEPMMLARLAGLSLVDFTGPTEPRECTCVEALVTTEVKQDVRPRLRESRDNRRDQ